MEEKLKKLIIENYKESFGYIEEIISEKPNWNVIKPNQYLTPTIQTIELPLNDINGEFYHYNQICETLEKLIAGEKAPYYCHFKEAPKEIVNILE